MTAPYMCYSRILRIFLYALDNISFFTILFIYI